MRQVAWIIFVTLSYFKHTWIDNVCDDMCFKNCSRYKNGSSSLFQNFKLYASKLASILAHGHTGLQRRYVFQKWFTLPWFKIAQFILLIIVCLIQLCLKYLSVTKMVQATCLKIGSGYLFRKRLKLSITLYQVIDNVCYKNCKFIKIVYLIQVCLK